jgi:hypothetical protein
MTKELIERYLTEKCGITAGPWYVKTEEDTYNLCHFVEEAKCWGFHGETYCWQNGRVMASSFSMLRDWILTAYKIWKHQESLRITNNILDSTFYLASNNITNALLGMDIDQRLEDIRRFCEEKNNVYT